jgi:hypothetical protein
MQDFPLRFQAIKALLKSLQVTLDIRQIVLGTRLRHTALLAGYRFTSIAGRQKRGQEKKPFHRNYPRKLISEPKTLTSIVNVVLLAA